MRQVKRISGCSEGHCSNRRAQHGIGGHCKYRGGLIPVHEMLVGYKAKSVLRCDFVHKSTYSSVVGECALVHVYLPAEVDKVFWAYH